MIAENVVVVRCCWDWRFRTFCPSRNDGLLLLNWHASFHFFGSFCRRIAVVALVQSYLLYSVLAISGI